MDDGKKHEFLEISISTIKILLCVGLFINIFVFLYYGLINRGNVMERDPIRYLTDWSVTVSENGDQTVKASLPQGIKDNEYLFFVTRKDVAVYIGGELRKEFVEKRDVNTPGGSFTKFLMFVPLREMDSGAEMIMERQSPQDVDQEVPKLYLGTYSGMIGYLLRTTGISFILSVIVLIFSFVAFIVSIVLRFWYRQRINMMYGALGIVIIASWLITDSYLFPFVFGVYHVNGLLNFLLCLLIPLPLAVFLSSMQRGRHEWITSIVMLVAAADVVIWPFLHFTGILPFYHVRDIANAVLVGLSISGIAILMLDACRGNISEYRYTFVGILGFLISGLIELSMVLLDVTFIRESVTIVSGLGFLLMFIVIQQVHDLRKVTAEKQRAIDISEAKTRFLASMSHEIRTPINAILGMNEMILRENNDKTVEEYSRNIKTSGKMLLMLVNDVLDFTKIESGKLEIKEAGFQLSDMLCDVMALIRERAEEKSLALKAQVNGEVPNELLGDEFRIRQILVNLLNNAVKYTEKGTITLIIGGNYQEDGYELFLLVKDTGKGIRKEDQERLFEAFSRADMKSNANIEGTGLGLAIVKSIVDSMNGTYGVESEYGVGSEFWVKLPVKYLTKELLRNDFMDCRKDAEGILKTVSFTAPDAKILAVDDNQSNLTIVKLFLKQNKIVPDLCCSGEQAIEMCREKKYDLILLDHMMPAPDGIETLHRIKKEEASLNKDTRAVVLTANAVAGSRQMYLREGFDDYLTKPLDSGALEELVRKMLPEEKVITADALLQAKEANEKEANDKEEPISLRSKLLTIEGLDYNIALMHCGGDEELLREIISDIAGEGHGRSERMKKSIAEKDFKTYMIDAHSIKSSTATLGLKGFSERARMHEYAARDLDTDFIYGEGEKFIGEYLDLCKKLERISVL